MSRRLVQFHVGPALYGRLQAFRCEGTWGDTVCEVARNMLQQTVREETRLDAEVATQTDAIGFQHDPAPDPFEEWEE